ncbi:MAG: GAF domain-containing protein [Chloroflexi bacterium]|nr:GAF domain-containing protein [Chloroflexota bacterium]
MGTTNVIEEKYYQSLYEVASAVNSARDPNDVLRAMVEMVARAMEAKACSLMLLAPDKKTLVHRTAFGLSDRYMRKGPVSADRSMAEALQGRPVAILKAADDERIQYRKQAREEGIASILSVPVTLRDEVVGVIRVYTAETRHFSAADTFFVGAVANLGAIALENATLREAREKEYRSLQQDLAEWTAALGWEWMDQGTVVPAREQD